MTKHMPPFERREGEMIKKLIRFSTARLFNSYRKIHPSEDRSDLTADFDSDLGECITKLKRDRPVTWIRLVGDPSEKAFEQPGVIGFLGLAMKRNAISAFRKYKKRTDLEASYLQDTGEVQESAERQSITKDMLEKLLKAFEAEGLDAQEVHQIFALQSQGHTRRDIAEKTGKSIHQVGRVITKVREIVSVIQNGGD